MVEGRDPSATVFATAAKLFSLLPTPIRLKIISALCTQIALEVNPHAAVASDERLTPHRAPRR